MEIKEGEEKGGGNVGKSKKSVNENHKLIKWNHRDAIHNYEEYIQLLHIQLILI